MKVDKDYKEAFNLGYELAKELNLSSPLLNDTNPGNSRISAMQTGMIEFIKENRKTINTKTKTEFNSIEQDLEEGGKKMNRGNNLSR